VEEEKRRVGAKGDERFGRGSEGWVVPWEGGEVRWRCFIVIVFNLLQCLILIDLGIYDFNSKISYINFDTLFVEIGPKLPKLHLFLYYSYCIRIPTSHFLICLWSQSSLVRLSLVKSKNSQIKIELHVNFLMIQLKMYQNLFENYSNFTTNFVNQL